MTEDREQSEYTALVPPTPVVDLPARKRPTALTVVAVLLFLFAAAELFLASLRITFISLSRHAVEVATYMQSHRPALPGSVRSIPHLIVWIQLHWILLAIFIVSVWFFTSHAIALLRMKPGIRGKILGMMVIRYLVGNTLLYINQWCFNTAYSFPNDFSVSTIYAFINLVFYLIVAILLCRPAVIQALRKEIISEDYSGAVR